MLFMVIARDGTDPDAPGRRQRVREQHLQEIQPHLQGGMIEYAGVFLDAEDVMRGSLLIIEAAGEAEVREFLEQDIYTRSGVWQDFEINPFRRAR